MLKQKLESLAAIEEAVWRFYGAAAERFASDEGLCKLLHTLEMEEKRHYAILKSLQALEEELPVFKLSFKVDEDSIAETLEKFQRCLFKLQDGTLTKIDLLHAIADIEFAEHNDLFLYTVNSINELLPEIITKAIDFKEHRAHIERFLSNRPEFSEIADKITRLPVVSKGRVLIVDDEKELVEAFNKLLSNDGIVDGALNGKEALAKLDTNDYAAIITDIMMPDMNGIEFYEKAIELHPDTKGRFIFLTNYVDTNYSFFKNNAVKYLEKPASIKDIKKVLSEVMHNYAQ